MSEHYFSNQPQSKSNPQSWSYRLRGNNITFTSDHGVFSKNEVDFGSRALIEAFKEPQISGEILDLGCGYGPIGLSIAKAFPNKQVALSDINERAVALASENANHNNIVNVRFKISDSLEAFSGNKFSAILTNPPIRAGKNVVHRMFEDSKKALFPDGELWVVIQKKQGAPSAQKKLEDLYGNVKIIEKKKGYYILKSKKV